MARSVRSLSNSLRLCGVVAASLFVFACARPSGGAPAASASTAPAASSASGASSGSGAASAGSAGSAAFAALGAEQRADYEGADAIVVARLVDPKIESILEIYPPIYVHSFALEIERNLSGMPLPAKRLTFSSRAQEKPFAAGARMIVAVRRVEQTLEGVHEDLEALRVDAATPALEAALAASFAPPADGLRLAIAQVPAAKVLKWRNEYGDGVFELTFANDASAPRAVPGVYVVHEPSGDRVVLDEALEVREERSAAHHLAGWAKGARPAGAVPLVLAPGAKASARVDVKPFGITNPMGGARVYYSFALGGLRASSFFYYTHDLHGPQMGK